MSNKTKYNSNVKKTKLSKREIATRALALFLALITIFGIVMMIIPVTDEHNHSTGDEIIYTENNSHIELPVTPQVPNAYGDTLTLP